VNFITALKYHESQGPEGAFATPSIEPLNNEGTSCRDLDIRLSVYLGIQQVSPHDLVLRVSNGPTPAAPFEPSTSGWLSIVLQVLKEISCSCIIQPHWHIISLS
jgi:hypothetical protein